MSDASRAKFGVLYLQDALMMIFYSFAHGTTIKLKQSSNNNTKNIMSKPGRKGRCGCCNWVLLDPNYIDTVRMTLCHDRHQEWF